MDLRRLPRVHRGGWPYRRATLPVLALLVAGGCSTAPGTGAPPSTIAPGSPWAGAFTAVVPPAPVNALRAVNCPTATSCWAVGSTVGGGGAPNGAAIVGTSDGGATWSAEAIPPTAAYLSGISCIDQRQCVAVGEAALSSNGQAVILTTGDGGRAWVSRPVPSGFLDITSVFCRADRQCTALGDVAGGAAALSSTSAGSSWVTRGALPAGVDGATGISCPDDLHCWVTAHRSPDPDHVTGVVAVTTDGGSSWTALSTVGRVGYLNGIACPDAGTTSPEPAASARSSGGASSVSTSSTAPGGGPAPPRGLPTAQCVVVGTTSDTLNGVRSGLGMILITTDGGLHWSTRQVPAAIASLADVSCTGVNSCVMVGSTVSSTTSAGSVLLTGPAGSEWHSLASVTLSQPLTGVSCSSQSHCVLVGESITEHLVGG